MHWTPLLGEAKTDGAVRRSIIDVGGSALRVGQRQGTPAPGSSWRGDQYRAEAAGGWTGLTTELTSGFITLCGTKAYSPFWRQGFQGPGVRIVEGS